MTEHQIKEYLAQSCPEDSYALCRYDGVTDDIYTLKWSFGQLTTTNLDMLWGYACAIVDYIQNYETKLKQMLKL